MTNDQPAQPEPDYERQAEELLRLNGLAPDQQPKGIDRSQRRLVMMAVVFVVFCLVITIMTMAAK